MSSEQWLADRHRAGEGRRRVSGTIILHACHRERQRQRPCPTLSSLIGMNSKEETQVPLLPIHNTPGDPSNSARTTGTTMRQKPTSFKLTDLTVNIPSSNRQPLTTSSGTRDKQVAPSRWSTIEFRIYYVVALVVIPIMIWIPVSLSSRMSFWVLSRGSDDN